MGDAEIDLKPYLQCVKMDLSDLPDSHVVKRVQPDRTNCLAEESSCIWKNGKPEMETPLMGRRNLPQRWNNPFNASPQYRHPKEEKNHQRPDVEETAA